MTANQFALSSNSRAGIIMEKIASAKLFGGAHDVWRHSSEVLGVDMEFATFIPEERVRFLFLYFLSGLTCTWENQPPKQAHSNLPQSMA